MRQLGDTWHNRMVGGVYPPPIPGCLCQDPPPAVSGPRGQGGEGLVCVTLLVLLELIVCL